MLKILKPKIVPFSELEGLLNDPKTSKRMLLANFKHFYTSDIFTQDFDKSFDLTFLFLLHNNCDANSFYTITTSLKTLYPNFSDTISSIEDRVLEEKRR